MTGTTAPASLEDSYRALHEDVAWLPLVRDVLIVEGPDALSYLQGQLSQDLTAVPAGSSAESLLLSPQGKMVALVRVSVVGPDRVVIDTAAGAGEAVRERLARFRLRVKADLLPVQWRGVALRGPRSEAAAAAITEHERPELTASVAYPGFTGIDVFFGELPPESQLVAATGTVASDPAAFEVARIEAGMPAMGSEIGESTIPHETGIVERTVSFTKGCYTGQELVARIDARGANTPRRLRGVELEAGAPMVAAGAAIVAGERSVGSVTSVAWSPRADAPVALAYVRREVSPPAACSVDPGREGTIRELPLYGA
jgi:folate-binding protein YgfZ